MIDAASLMHTVVGGDIPHYVIIILNNSDRTEYLKRKSPFFLYGFRMHPHALAKEE